MKKNTIALLLALSLTLTQSVEMVVPVAASELNTEIAQEVVQEETEAEEEVTGSDTAEADVSETIASDERTSEDAAENRTEVNRQDEEKQNAESVVTEDTENSTDEVEVLDAEDEGKTAESDIPEEDTSKYLLMPQELKDASGNPFNPFVGETVDIADLGVKLYKYEDGNEVPVETVDGHSVKIVVANNDYDSRAWEPAGRDQNQDITKITRISEEDTYISLTAMCEDDNGEWNQIASKTYDIAQADLGDEEKIPYYLNTDYEDTIGECAMLPEHEMTIKTQLVQKEDWSPVEAYKLKVLFAPSAVTVTVKENGKDLLVKSGNKTGSFTCYVSVLMPDEDGKYKEAFKNRVIIEVSKYLLMPQELNDQAGNPINPAVGESINLADLGMKLGKYSDGKIDLIDDVDGHPVKSWWPAGLMRKQEKQNMIVIWRPGNLRR